MREKQLNGENCQRNKSTGVLWSRRGLQMREK